jgi:hypothetical protein
LRILVAISSPSDHPRLDVSREWENLNRALEASIKSGLIALDRIEGGCTFDNLRDALRPGLTHVFHFVGHGEPGKLVLENDAGDGVVVDATRLRAAFPEAHPPRLVVLNACAGAMHDSESVFSGVAQGFIRRGVPAVVGMQAAITDKAAIHLARYFYRELALGRPVDEALTEARLRLQGNGNLIEWGTPVLYMRATDGRLVAARQPLVRPLAMADSPTKPAQAPAPLVRPVTPEVKATPLLDKKPALQATAPVEVDMERLLAAERSSHAPWHSRESVRREMGDLPWYIRWFPLLLLGAGSAIFLISFVFR